MSFKYKDGNVMGTRLRMTASHQKYLLYDNELRRPGMNNLPERRRGGEEILPRVDLSDPNSEFFVKQRGSPKPISKKIKKVEFVKPETLKMTDDETGIADPKLLTKMLDYIAERQESYRRLAGAPIFSSKRKLSGQPPELSNWGPPPVQIPGLKSPASLKFTMPLEGVELPEVVEQLKKLKEKEDAAKVNKKPTRVVKMGGKELMTLSNSKGNEFLSIVGKSVPSKRSKLPLSQNPAPGHTNKDYTALMTKATKARILQLIEEKHPLKDEIKAVKDNMQRVREVIPPLPPLRMNRTVDLKIPSIRLAMLPGPLTPMLMAKTNPKAALAASRVVRPLPKVAEKESSLWWDNLIFKENPSKPSATQMPKPMPIPNAAGISTKIKVRPTVTGHPKATSLLPMVFPKRENTGWDPLFPLVKVEQVNFPSIKIPTQTKKVTTVPRTQTIPGPNKIEVVRFPNVLNEYHKQRMVEMENLGKLKMQKVPQPPPMVRSERNSSLMFDIRLNGKDPTPALLDTALSFSLVTKRLSDQLGLSKYMVPQSPSMKAIYSLSPVVDSFKYPKILGSLHSLRVRVGLATPFMLNFQVVQDAQCDCVLGVDFVRTSQPVINLHENTISFDQGKYRVRFMTPSQISIMGKPMGSYSRPEPAPVSSKKL